MDWHSAPLPHTPHKHIHTCAPFQADHYTHIIDNGYDWHVNGTTDKTKLFNYSGNLVRDDAIAFINGAGRTLNKPFFLYLPFQECHAPFQVDKKYSI